MFQTIRTTTESTSTNIFINFLKSSQKSLWEFKVCECPVTKKIFHHINLLTQVGRSKYLSETVEILRGCLFFTPKDQVFLGHSSNIIENKRPLVIWKKVNEFLLKLLEKNNNFQMIIFKLETYLSSYQNLNRFVGSVKILCLRKT